MEMINRVQAVATDMSAPRVLMVVAQFYPIVGGTENQALLLSAQLVKQGVDVTVLTRPVAGMPAQELVGGVTVYRALRTVDRGKLFGITYALACLWFMLANRRHYDIIHCHILQGFHSPAAMLMKLFFRKKVIIKVASTGVLSDFTMLKKTLCGSLLLRLLCRTDRIVTLCRASTDEARAHGFACERIVHIPNGVDTQRFRPARQAAGRRTRIACVASLNELKGIDILIEACALLNRAGLHLRLDLFGRGPLQARLEALAAGYGLAEQVVFHGAVRDIEACLDDACVFVQPSLVEGMSNVLLEAMAAGLPVVATRTGAAPEVICDGASGLLVDAGSAQQICAAVERIVSDEAFASRLGSQARTVAQSRYAIETVAETYCRLYQCLLNVSGPCVSGK